MNIKKTLFFVCLAASTNPAFTGNLTSRDKLKDDAIECIFKSKSKNKNNTIKSLLEEAVKDNTKSEQYLLKAYNIDPDNTDVLYNLGLYYKTRKKYDLAEKYCLLAITRNDIRSLSTLAELYMLQKKYDLAEKYYLLVVEYNKEDNLARHQLAEIDKLQKKLGSFDSDLINIADKSDQKNGKNPLTSTM